MFEFEEFNASPQAIVLVSGTYLSLVAAGCCVDAIFFLRSFRKRIDWAGLRERLQARACTSSDAFGLICAWVFLRALQDGLTLSIGQDPDPAPLLTWALSFSLITQLAVVLAALVLLRHRHGDLATGLGTATLPPGRAALYALALYVGSLPVFLAGAQVWGWFLEALNIQVTEQDVVRQFLGLDHRGLEATFILIAIAGAPITEEIVFRGVFLPALIRRLGVWRAAAAVSLIFAIVHIHLPTLLPLFLISFAFSLGYILSGSILVPIFMHALFNGVSLGCVIAIRVLSS